MESGESLDIEWQPPGLPEAVPTPESEEERERRRWVGVLNDARIEIEEIVQNEPGIDPEDAELSIDRLHLDLESRYFQNGSFAFWGGFSKDLAFPELRSKQDLIPVIKNLRIPESMRGRGVGTNIAKAWEKVMTSYNFDYLVATNIDTKDAVKFWKKQGFQLKPSDSEDNPYYMFKKI